MAPVQSLVDLLHLRQDMIPALEEGVADPRPVRRHDFWTLSNEVTVESRCCVPTCCFSFVRVDLKLQTAPVTGVRPWALSAQRKALTASLIVGGWDLRALSESVQHRRSHFRRRGLVGVGPN